MEQLPHFLQGPLYGHEVPLVGTHLTLAARSASADPDAGLDSIEMGFRWWDAGQGRWACFTAITYGGSLPTPRPRLAPEEHMHRERNGPPAAQPPPPYPFPIIPNNPSKSSDEVLSSADEPPTDIGSEDLGQFPHDDASSDTNTV